MKRFKLIDMIEGVELAVGSFKDLAKVADVHPEVIKWSYYQKEIVKGRYLVVEYQENATL